MAEKATAENKSKVGGADGKVSQVREATSVKDIYQVGATVADQKPPLLPENLLEDSLRSSARFPSGAEDSAVNSSGKILNSSFQLTHEVTPNFNNINGLLAGEGVGPQMQLNLGEQTAVNTPEMAGN